MTLTVELPPGKYRTKWISTQNGLGDENEPVQHAGGPMTLKSPVFSDDIALRILAAE